MHAAGLHMHFVELRRGRQFAGAMGGDARTDAKDTAMLTRVTEVMYAGPFRGRRVPPTRTMRRSFGGFPSGHLPIGSLA